MGNFLVLIPGASDGGQGETLFRHGVDLLQEVKGPGPSKIVTQEWSLAAAFPRRNGSGGVLVADELTESWLLTIGTWLHHDGYASGEELRLLQRYLQVGPDRLARELEGFFIVAIGDGRTRETLVLTDVVGSCHAFRRAHEDGLLLCSSSFVLAALGQSTLDSLACQEFLSSGIIYEDRTLHREVRKLGPASVYRFGQGKSCPPRRYWQITEVEPESLDGPAAVERLGGAMIQAARRITQTFARPICDLTGGYDSRALVAMFQSAGASFATVVAGPAESPDVQISRRLAALAGRPHLHIPPLEPLTLERLQNAFALTDGEFDLVEYARILDIHEQLAQSFDISLNGSFGEVARGYWWELLFPHTGARGRLDARKIAQQRFAAQPADLSLFPPDGRQDLVEHFAGVIERTNEGLFDQPNTVQMNHAYLLMRMQRWQGRIGSSTNQLWPCLPPFLFRSVLEIMLGTRARLCRRSLLIRQLLGRYQPALAAEPLEHGHPALPFTWRTAPRFWPAARHFGTKVVRKVLAKAGYQGGQRPSSGSPRLQLWKEAETKELLHPANMRLTAFTDRERLASFLRHSQAPAFPYDGQWGRVLTLEITLHKLAAYGLAVTGCGNR